MFLELDKYYESYKDKFQEFSQKIGPVVDINQSLNYFANRQNMRLKLMADSDPHSIIKWFIDIKKSAKAADRLSSDPNGSYQKIRRLSSMANQLMDQLPRVRSSQY